MDDKTKDRIERQMKQINNIFKTSNDKIEVMENEIAVPGDFDLMDAPSMELTNDGSVFDLVELKTDFIMVKRNLKKLIDSGQRLFDQTIGLDLEDLKAGQIAAIAELSNSINKNLMDLVNIYKLIVDIESVKRGSNQVPGALNSGIQTLNQQVFVGNAADALKHINKKE